MREQFGQSHRSGVDVEISRIEGEIGDLGIQRRANRGEVAQHLLAIRTREQRARAIVRKPRELLFDAGLQVHDETMFAQQRTVAGIEHRATTGGEHDAFFPKQARHCGALALAETCFALAFEKLHDRRAALALDFPVRIQQTQAEARGQVLANAGFAGAHGADEDQVGGRIHGSIVAAVLTNRGVASAFRAPHSAPHRHSRETTMSVAKIIELNAASKTSMEDAVKAGMKKCAESVKNIKGAWVNEIKVVTDDGGNVVEWRVNLRVTFVVE